MITDGNLTGIAQCLAVSNMFNTTFLAEFVVEIATAMSNSVRLLQGVTATATSSSDASDDMMSLFTNLQSSVAELTSTVQKASTNLINFQNTRATCVNSLLNLQASIWCLACDPNAATKGYDDSTGILSISNDVCTRIKGDCYPYVVSSELQNSAFDAQKVITFLSKMSELIKSNVTATGIASALSYSGTEAADRPANCTSAAGCDWICTKLFTNGFINQQRLMSGGDVSSSSKRILEELTITVASAADPQALRPRVLAERALASGSYNPSATEAGTTSTFKADPAGIQAEDAAITAQQNSASKSGVMTFGSVFASIMMVVLSMML